MNEILKEQGKTSGEIWNTFKQYVENHDIRQEDFFDGLMIIGDRLDEKYCNTSLHPLQAHLWAGLVNSLYELYKEKK